MCGERWAAERAVGAIREARFAPVYRAARAALLPRTAVRSGSESNPPGQDVWAVGGAVLQAEWASGYGADRKVANFVYQDGCNNTCTGLDLDRSFLWGNGLAEQ